MNNCSNAFFKIYEFKGLLEQAYISTFEEIDNQSISLVIYIAHNFNI